MFGANLLALEALATEVNAAKAGGYEICCQFYCNTSFTDLFINYLYVRVFIYICTRRYTYIHLSVF